MLNISKYSIAHKVNTDDYSVFNKLASRSVSKVLIRLLTGVSIISIASMFLPWTQNIRSNGYVTTLNPYDKPQAIQSLIDGRLETWFVREGDYVNVGDTILQISESKEEYLDPQIIARTSGQIDAKANSAEAYQDKAAFLSNQYRAMLKNKDLKLQQNQFKIEQTEFKIKSDSIELAAAEIQLENGNNQLKRTQELFDKGLKSLTELENKRYKQGQAQAKVTELINILNASRVEIDGLKANRSVIINEFDEKLSKIEAERAESISSQYKTEAEVDKLKSDYNKYKVRSDAYFITSPISGYITQTVKEGIGEFIKAGEDIVTIIPKNLELAVEMYVLPRDVPLLKKGQKVRILFDGWPAIVFSGWPNTSYGTYGGEIFAIDNFISENNKYRILVKQDPNDEQWPDGIRVGGGSNALILLNEVQLYYELWRQLNGFPPDYYEKQEMDKIKSKAPIKRLK